jgi:hypothetical protein
MTHADELRALLNNYTGGEQVYRHNLVRSFNYTEGARAFFQNAGKGAYWLADILATEPKVAAAVRQHNFCLAVLHVTGTTAKVMVARDGVELNDGQGNVIGIEGSGIAFEQALSFTDCPEGIWKFYLTWTEVGDAPVVLCMLPREY